MKDEQTVLVPPQGVAGKDASQKTFAFDKSYWSFDRSSPNYAGQDHLHNDLGKPLLDNAFQGYNNCIFAYGQTGSGKSYSMMGYGKEAGVIPKICQDMFERIGALQQDPHLQCTVEVSYLEIYNERVRDLLNPSTKGNLRVREHPSTGPYVEDLAKLVVSSFNEIEHLMDEGNKARTVAATNMNETSSRSHAVFTLTLTQRRHDVETKMSTEKVAKISLVDLAGSERATSTGATGARLKEGAEINRSLSTLGRVIAALADLSTNKKKKGGAAAQVPYRDSVLTWLLKDSLGGNSMTAMIAAISPADINFDETLSTLRYADSAKRIKNHAVVNEDPNARMIRELKEELAQLRSKLRGSVNGSGPTEEVYPEGTPLEQQYVSITQADGTTKRVTKAEIMEQLNQSEKLYTDLNQTWEQKLAKTEEIHKEREAALEELGISIEKGFVGLHTPKKMPHLVNLSDDPLLAECLVYNLKPGTTTVRNVTSDSPHTASEIRLNGSRIQPEHCTFENVDNIVTVVPKEGASVMVNGQKITEPKRLRSGYRIILGDFQIFRFNHPQEAKAERAEHSQSHSLLRHSVTASISQSPSPGPYSNHVRNYSKANSEVDWDSSRPESPAPFFSSQGGRDSDWSFARREAASAILGPDQKIAGLTDEELNALFEDVQRARAERERQARETTSEDDNDGESSASYVLREKYASNGTIDNFSLDTALTMPNTPREGEREVEDKLREVRGEMQVRLDKQKEEYQVRLQTAEAANVEVEEIRMEKERMEQVLQETRAEMVRQLEVQRKEFEERLVKLLPPEPRGASLDERELEIAKRVAAHWRGRRYVRMAESILQNAATLKEAQVMSQELDESAMFQFVILDEGHALCSSYDMVLNGIDGNEDSALEEAPRPCVAVRVMDYGNSVSRIWSLEKLRDRVRRMRQMHQYMDRPEYLQHFKLENPFMETFMPQYTVVGDVDVPLAAVFESRVQDFSLDVRSPYTSDAVGLIKLSLEPSSARAPSNTLKFNVVMHDMHGFAEHEGTEIHAQLFIPGISEEGGVTTTQMISDFEDGPVRFESVHSMSLPLVSPSSVALRVSIFAKVTSMHLDKLLSWDEMRDSAPVKEKQRRKSARVAETQFFTEEKHDVFARMQILELAETGEYLPMEVLQTGDLDSGTFQLHQGLQRRIVLNLTYGSGSAPPWKEVTNLRVGKIRLVDQHGKTPDMSSPAPDIALKLMGTPTVKENANGTTNVVLVGQWDSSLHNSVLLDRVTAEKYKVQLSLLWSIASERVTAPMSFSLDLHLQILSRSHVRQQSMFASLWQSVRIVHSVTGIFCVTLRPAPVKRVGDLWRMNTEWEYVKGEENLPLGWTPRSVSLVNEFLAAKRRRLRSAEVEGARARWGAGVRAYTSPKKKKTPGTAAAAMAATASTNGEGPKAEGAVRAVEGYPPRQKALLEKLLHLWTAMPKQAAHPAERLLHPAHTTPPTNGTADPATTATPRLTATVHPVLKNPTLLRGGYLLVPSTTSGTESPRWIRRFVELRRPYLHLHSVPDGEEIGLISLRNSRVDAEPPVTPLLSCASSTGSAPAGEGAGGGRSPQPPRGPRRENVFAVYGPENSYLFCAKGERDKGEWILAVDRAYWGEGGLGDEDDGAFGGAVVGGGDVVEGVDDEEPVRWE